MSISTFMSDSAADKALTGRLTGVELACGEYMGGGIGCPVTIGAGAIAGASGGGGGMLMTGAGCSVGCVCINVTCCIAGGAPMITVPAGMVEGIADGMA